MIRLEESLPNGFRAIRSDDHKTVGEGLATPEKEKFAFP